MGKFQNFNVAPGVDPMGIGVPDYGRSSFDPVEFVRRTWDEAQLKQAFGKKEEYDRFQKQLGALPEKAKAWEQKSINDINNLRSQVESIESDLYKRGVYKSGYVPTGKDEKDMTKRDTMVDALRTKIGLYNQEGKWYDQDVKMIRDLATKGEIDEGLTMQRMDEYYNLGTAEEKAARRADITKPLIVMRPKEVDKLKAIAEGANTFLRNVIGTEVTPQTLQSGEYLKTIETADPVLVERGMGQMWDAFPEEYKNSFIRDYDKAPKSEKTAIEGDAEITITPKDWFISKWAPGYAKKINLKSIKKPSEFTFNWNNVLPQKNKQTGQYDLSGLKGVKTYATEATPSGMQKLNYNAEAVMPLNNVFGTKEMMLQNTPNTINTTTGQKEDETMALRNIPYELAIHPVAVQKTEFVDKDGKKWTFEKGERIPADIQRQMDEINRQEQKPKYLYKHETFMNSQTYYRQITETGEMARVMKDFDRLPDDTASYMVTTTRPWKEALNALKSEAIARKIDLQPLINWVNEVEGQLNFDYKKLRGEKAPQEYEDIFK
jgi:hypothetical protein